MKDILGGKGAGLAEMSRLGIPVPPGFALSCEAFRLFVREAGLHDVIAHALERASSGDVDAVNRASHSISEAMQAQFSAPSSWPANNAFLRLSTIGRMPRSTLLVSSSMRPSSRKRMRPSQRFKP